MTSCLFPWFSEYDIFDLPDIDAIADVMQDAGKIAMDAGNDLVSTGPFNCLALTRRGCGKDYTRTQRTLRADGSDGATRQPYG